MASVAESTREAARARPFLVAALRAGVVNYAAAAAVLDVDGDGDSVAAALRRFAADLPPYEAGERSTRVRMRSGVGLRGAGAEATGDGDGSGAAVGGDEDGDPLLSVAGTDLVDGAGSLTAVLATGEVDAAALAATLGRLRTADVAVEAAGVAGDALLVVVGRRDGARAVRVVEGALSAVPE
jgi:hypothetical protein